MPAINWYPGHMTKTRRMLQENLKMIDVVVEVLDARAPLASRNPDFDDLFAGKARVVLLNKSDLADSNATKRWITYYNRKGIEAAGISATGGSAKKIAVALIEKAAKPRVDAMKAKGVNKVVRAMIVGIVGQYVAKPDILKRIHLGDHSLMRRIIRHHPAKVSHIAVSDRQTRRQIKLGKCFARARYLAHIAVGVRERRHHRVPPPKARPAAASLLCLPTLGPYSS